MSATSIKILFIGPHRPNRNGSQRFRMEQFFPYLKQEGFICDYSWYINEKDDGIFYSPGNSVGKLGVFLKAIFIRLRDVLRANHYDIIFIQREALMIGSVFFELQFARSKAKVVFDFDDAIWLEDTSPGNKKFKWLKRPSKTTDIIRCADLVLAGNNYLAAYANEFNRKVAVIPTVVDTDIYLPGNKIDSADKPVCIGWSGGKTTVKHFELITPVLKSIQEKYGAGVRFMQIGDKNFKVPGLSIESVDWTFANEVDTLNRFDIGIMPLPDDEWSKGKCGFKAIQYMALEIPSVVSPVGVNPEIISHSESGFLATTDEDWVTYLSMLLKSYDLRRSIGIKARMEVVKRFSVQAYIGQISSLFKELVNQQ